MNIKTFQDGSIFNLSNIADSLRVNASSFLSSLDTPEPHYSDSFTKMYEYIASKIESDSKLSEDMQLTALKLLYFNKDRCTLNQMKKLFKFLGKTA